MYDFATLVAKECSKIKQASQGSLGLSIPNPPAMLGSFALPIRRDAFSSLFQRGYPLVTFFPCSVPIASSQIGPKKCLFSVPTWKFGRQWLGRIARAATDGVSVGQTACQLGR